VVFNSFIFILFFFVVYGLYLGLKKSYKVQNLILLVASYIFYGYWDWRFLLLLASSTLIDYFVGIEIGKAQGHRRKLFLLMSVFSNLGILLFFKYFNFFTESFVDLLNQVGVDASYTTLKIVLPVGISFYTFQTLSYSIDIYRGKLKATRSIPDFALFVSFFPQLVAGPIERAKHLLPQISSARKISVNQISTGLNLIIWGFFKKVFIADNIGLLVDHAFDNYTQFYGLDLLLYIFAFSIQIYCDFSAYSDIARGISKLMGFDLMLNFKLPFFAVNPSDFWNRWHISLSTWLRDYLYIPLGGNRGSHLKTYRNLFLTMLLGGLWHGASWNFIYWGLFHGIILIIYRLIESKYKISDSALKNLSKMLLMFLLTQLGWLIFRSESVHQIFYFIKSSAQLDASSHTLIRYLDVLFFVWPLIVIQLIQRRTGDLNFISSLNPVVRTLIYFVLFVLMCFYGVRESTEFIYFQF
jgi:alginate O-acetyltransferase complex protein AlgI